MEQRATKKRQLANLFSNMHKQTKKLTKICANIICNSTKLGILNT